MFTVIVYLWSLSTVAKQLALKIPIERSLGSREFHKGTVNEYVF